MSFLINTHTKSDWLWNCMSKSVYVYSFIWHSHIMIILSLLLYAAWGLRWWNRWTIPSPMSETSNIGCACTTNVHCSYLENCMIYLYLSPTNRKTKTFHCTCLHVTAVLSVSNNFSFYLVSSYRDLAMIDWCLLYRPILYYSYVDWCKHSTIIVFPTGHV